MFELLFLQYAIQITNVSPTILQYKNNMKPNLTITDKKKTIVEIIAQLGLDQQKIQRKSEIIACLQLGTSAQDPVGFKDKLADWMITNYFDLKTNTQLFLQYGNLKYLAKESRDLLANLFKKCDETLGDSIDYSDMYHSFVMKNPYVGYQHMGYMYPPYMMGPAYPPANDRQGYDNFQKMYNMDMQQYYMQMAKYGYSQMYIPPMPMPVPKYTGAQTSDMVMKNPYYTYPVMQPPPISLNPQTYPPQPTSTFTSTPTSNPPPPSKPKLQSPVQPSGPGPKLRTSQMPISRQSAKQLNVNYEVEENQKQNSHIVKTVLRERTKKIGPFTITAPHQQKVQREEIPERLYPIQVIDHNAGNPQMAVSNSNSDIEIVQKNPNQPFGSSQTLKPSKIPKQKKLLPNPNNNQQFNNTSNIAPSALHTRNYDKSQQNNNSSNLHGYNNHEKAHVKNSIQYGLEFKDELKHCLCKGYGIYEDLYTCFDCGRKFHYFCTDKKINIKQKQNKQSSMNAENNPHKDGQSKSETICHFCFMKNIDPLNKAEKQIKILYIVDIKRTKINQFIDFQQYDSYHAKNSPYEIQARCMRLEDAANMNPEYTWPDQCLVMLNEQKTIQFQALQHNSSLKKRKDMSIFLTSYIYSYNRNWAVRKNLPVGLEIKDNTPTEISQKKIRNNYVFVFGLYLIKKKTPEQLLQQIMKDPTNKVNYAEKFFSQQTVQDQIQIQQIKVTLMDPFTWNLIDVPARGRKCIHGQCFDLKTFLSFMNVQKFRQWRCPVCNKECRNFYIDVQQLQVIKQFKKHQNQESNKKFSKQIQFHRDGRTLFVVQNDEDEGQDDRNNNSTDANKTKLIAKQSKDSKDI